FTLCLRSSDPPLHLHSFPPRRSSDLRPGVGASAVARRAEPAARRGALGRDRGAVARAGGPELTDTLQLLPPGQPPAPLPERPPLDRKSTRLNSSHEWISYAVFCLKKK